MRRGNPAANLLAAAPTPENLRKPEIAAQRQELCSAGAGGALMALSTGDKGTPRGYALMGGAGARIGSFLAGAGCCLLTGLHRHRAPKRETLFFLLVLLLVLFHFLVGLQRRVRFRQSHRNAGVRPQRQHVHRVPAGQARQPDSGGPPSPLQRYFQHGRCGRVVLAHGCAVAWRG